MNEISKTLYIPLYGKAVVSRKRIILHDETAEIIWEQEGFRLRGKSRSKWLAYTMSMRAAVFDAWLRRKMEEDAECTILHIGCGMDARVNRVGTQGHAWFDIDFPEVIAARRKYFREGDGYHMLAADVNRDGWLADIPSGGNAAVVMEGVSMYMPPEKLQSMMRALREHFGSVKIMMDCYTTFAAKAGKLRNPVSEVGVMQTWGMDDPEALAKESGFVYTGEHDMTPDVLVGELRCTEQAIFCHVYGGSFARKLYRMHEFAAG